MIMAQSMVGVRDVAKGKVQETFPTFGVDPTSFVLTLNWTSQVSCKTAAGERGAWWAQKQSSQHGSRVTRHPQVLPTALWGRTWRAWIRSPRLHLGTDQYCEQRRLCVGFWISHRASGPCSQTKWHTMAKSPRVPLGYDGPSINQTDGPGWELPLRGDPVVNSDWRFQNQSQRRQLVCEFSYDEKDI